MSRLTGQKGIHLMKHALRKTLERGGQARAPESKKPGTDTPAPSAPLLASQRRSIA